MKILEYMIIAAFLLCLLFISICDTPFTFAKEPLNEKEINSILKADAKPVDFSFSEKYATERKIVRKFSRLESFPPSGEHTVDALEIALLDVNNDGKKDILHYEPSDFLCGNQGLCPFGILLRNETNGWKSVLETVIRGEVLILSTKNHGYYDIRYNNLVSGDSFEIWRFDGEQYDLIFSGYTQKDSGIDTLSIQIHDSDPLKFRFVDKR